MTQKKQKENKPEETKEKEKTKAEKKKATEQKVEGLWKEFKKFITRGNVVDMSIGVIIGSAFGAIVAALTSILLNVCTWGIPGGLKSVITVLPPSSSAQAGITILGKTYQTISLRQYYDLISSGPSNIKDIIASQYTLHGSTYIYNGAAYIDWGTFINAVISFFVIGLTLFTIIKIAAVLKKKREKMHAEALEKYYKKHPELRPAPVEPGIPEPTDHQLLKGILAELQAQNKSKNKND